MKNYPFLAWYFGSLQAKILYFMDYPTLREIGLDCDDFSKLDDVVQCLENEVKGLIESIEKVYKEVCSDYISKANIVTRRRNNWGFEIKILKKSTHKIKNKVSYFGVSIEANLKNKPSILLYVRIPRSKLHGFANIMNNSEYKVNDAINMWGKCGGKNHFIVGEISLKKRGGIYRSEKEILEKFSQIVKDKLLRQRTYSILEKLSKEAK
jgi:hypothetical protein